MFKRWTIAALVALLVAAVPAGSAQARHGDTPGAGNECSGILVAEQHIGDTPYCPID
jgi:hypothetical protein